MAQLKIEIPRAATPVDAAFLGRSLEAENKTLVSDAEMHAAQERAYVFLRNEENAICGGALVLFSFDIAYVNVFWVAAEHRKKGEGRRLYRAVEDLAYLKKKKRANLCVFDFQNSVGFWERTGFVRFGTMPSDVAGRDVIYMYKTIESEVR